MSEQNKDAERARIVDAMCMTWRHDFGLDRKEDEIGSCGMTEKERDALRRQMGQLYDHHFAASSLPVGVPDGYMPIPTAEQLADALDGVRCFHDMSAELIAPELLANLLAAISVQQSAHVSVPRELLEDLRDCANECYNHARFRGTSGLDTYERLTEEADALLNGGEA